MVFHHMLLTGTVHCAYALLCNQNAANLHASQIHSKSVLYLCILRKLFAFPRQEPIKTNTASILVALPREKEL